MNAYVDSQDTSFTSRDVEDSSFVSAISRRGIVFVGIVLLHVFLIYAFASGLAHRIIESVAPPLETTIIEEVQKHDVTPPPPPLRLERPPVEVPPPEVTIDLPAADSAITDVTDKHVQPVAAPAPPPPPPPEAVTAPFGRAGYLNNPPPEYPALAARLKWEGTVLLRVRVLSTGRVDSIEVAKSSGHKVLDDQAMQTVRAWLFTPSKRGATAIDGWATVPIEFKIDT